MPPQTAIIKPWSECEADPDKRKGLTSAIDMYVQESSYRLSEWGLIDAISDNFHLFLHGHKVGGKRYKYRLNLIQLVPIANAAIQVGDRPKITFKPRETGEKPTCYINTKLSLPEVSPPQPIQPTAQAPEYDRNTGHVDVGAASMLQEAIDFVRPETYLGPMPQPLNDNESAYLKNLSEISEQMRLQAMASGAPEPMGILPKDFLIEVNDFTTAEALQTIFDIKAENSNFSRYVVENVLYNNIFGYQFMLVEFDDERKRFIFANKEFLTVHVDPFKTDIRDCQYAIVDEFLGDDEAKALYPDLSEAIDEKATQGPPTIPGFTPSQVPLPWFQALMGRKVVILRTAWLRNQPFPLSPDEAMARGLITVAQVPVDPEAVADPTTDENSPGFFNRLLSGAKALAGITDGSPPPNSADSPDASGQSGMATVVRSRPAYFLPGSADEIDETHPKWPIRRGIRQIRIIAQQVVDDRECERVDIPLGHNVNIPIMFTPYGQGEPEKLEPLQRAYNSTLTDICEHGNAVAFAPKIASTELVTKYPDLLRLGFNQPNKVYAIDAADILRAGGIKNVVGSIEPPALPADTWRREQVLSEKFDRQSDQSAILRGDTPSDKPLSGQAIGGLQSAAKNSIVFKSGRTKDMLRYVVRVMAGDIVYRHTPEELAEEVQKYPIQVWYDFHNRLQKHVMESVIGIEIEGDGSGQQDKANKIAAAQGGVQISQQTLMEALGIDPDTELNNIQQWARKASMMQSQAGPGAKGDKSGAGKEDKEPAGTGA